MLCVQRSAPAQPFKMYETEPQNDKPTITLGS